MHSVEKLAKKMKTFLIIDWQTKILMLKVFCLCGVIRALILIIPFKKIKPFLGTHNEETRIQANRSEYLAARKIKTIVEIVSRHTPWESKCLVQAIVAQLLLKRQKVETTLYLGVRKGEEGALKAHAWLRCGQMIVTGERARLGYKAVTKFANYRM